jgi:hypothetical protein
VRNEDFLDIARTLQPELWPDHVEHALGQYRNQTNGVTWVMVGERHAELVALLQTIEQEQRIASSPSGEDPQAVLRLDHYHPHNHDERYAIHYHEHGVPPHTHEAPARPSWLARWWTRCRGEDQ